ncbi:hypothetical protein HMPREF1545_03335 [Oscillibacter sp. KLE 1728]|nr:hypothetical protein HMPREF1545_03335 [Oscillibacter sp. KLE 1728]
MREKQYRRTAFAVRLYFANWAEGAALHVHCRDDGSRCRKSVFP